MRRLLLREFRPDADTVKVGLLESVMDETLTGNADFGDWILHWLDLVSQTQIAGVKSMDDDIKCAVVVQRAPRELKDHLVVQTTANADTCPVMRDIVDTWNQPRRNFGVSGHPHGAMPLEVCVMGVDSVA